MTQTEKFATIFDASCQHLKCYNSNQHHYCCHQNYYDLFFSKIYFQKPVWRNISPSHCVDDSKDNHRTFSHMAYLMSHVI